MTPQSLYAAVLPLWERDAGFKVPDLSIYSDFSAFIHDAMFDGDYHACLPMELVHALIRDRIVERLGEMGYDVAFAYYDGNCNIELIGGDDGKRPAYLVTGRADRTLSLIEAAMKATAPAGSPPP